MPVSLDVFNIAAEHVQKLYKNERALAKKEHRPVRTFNELIHATMNDVHIPRNDRNDLVHELAVFFGRRGGKAPRKQKVSKRKKEVALSASLLRDLRATAREANEHIVPID